MMNISQAAAESGLSAKQIRDIPLISIKGRLKAFGVILSRL